MQKACHSCSKLPHIARVDTVLIGEGVKHVLQWHHQTACTEAHNHKGSCSSAALAAAQHQTADGSRESSSGFYLSYIGE